MIKCQRSNVVSIGNNLVVINVMKLTSAETHEQYTTNGKHSTRDNKPSRSILVKDGPNVDAAKEGEKGVDGKNPADSSFVIVAELVVESVGLESTNGVHESEGGK